MAHNLIPPFLLREAGVVVFDIPKIHVTSPTIEDHSIYFDSVNLCIPLKLQGIFSYFPTPVPTDEEIEFRDKLFLTPDSTHWDPYSDQFALHEDSMLDWEGNMIVSRSRPKHNLGELPYTAPVDLYAACVQSIVDSAFINHDEEPDTFISAANLDSFNMAQALSHKYEDGKFGMSIGAVHSCSTSITPLFNVELDFDNPEFEIHGVIGSTIGYKPKKITAEFISKIWRISNE